MEYNLLHAKNRVTTTWKFTCVVYNPYNRVKQRGNPRAGNAHVGHNVVLNCDYCPLVHATNCSLVCFSIFRLGFLFFSAAFVRWNFKCRKRAHCSATPVAKAAVWRWRRLVRRRKIPQMVLHCFETEPTGCFHSSCWWWWEKNIFFCNLVFGNQFSRIAISEQKVECNWKSFVRGCFAN